MPEDRDDRQNAEVLHPVQRAAVAKRTGGVRDGARFFPAAAGAEEFGEVPELLPLERDEIAELRPHAQQWQEAQREQAQDAGAQGRGREKVVQRARKITRDRRGQLVRLEAFGRRRLCGCGVHETLDSLPDHHTAARRT
jgi:hypothetical protein